MKMINSAMIRTKMNGGCKTLLFIAKFVIFIAPKIVLSFNLQIYMSIEI